MRIPYLGRARGEAENPHNADANSCKKQGNGQDDPERPGWSCEVCWEPPVLGAKAKEGQELKLSLLLVILHHKTHFPLTTNHCANCWGLNAELPEHHSSPQIMSLLSHSDGVSDPTSQ